MWKPEDRQSHVPRWEWSLTNHSPPCSASVVRDPGTTPSGSPSLHFLLADLSLISILSLGVLHDYIWVTLFLGKKQEKEKSLEIGLENHRLVRESVNQIINYCHSSKEKTKNVRQLGMWKTFWFSESVRRQFTRTNSLISVLSKSLKYVLLKQ